jgi:hypothetical protein
MQLLNCSLGKQLLELFEKIDPGQSKLRGELLLELQSSSVLLAQRALKEEKITAYQAKVRRTFIGHKSTTVFYN